MACIQQFDVSYDYSEKDAKINTIRGKIMGEGRLCSVTERRHIVHRKKECKQKVNTSI